MTAVDPQTSEEISCNQIVPYNSSIAQFIVALKKCPAYAGYLITGTRKVYDENATELASDKEADHGKKYEWTIEVGDIRTDEEIEHMFDW